MHKKTMKFSLYERWPEKGDRDFVGSVLLGENDNTILSGYGNTIFRKRGKIGEKDF